jgi:glycosyltransferase involved in cell wall biosynthesis
VGPPPSGDHTGPATPAVKYSVCLPATRPETVGHAIASIQAQTLTDWELLIVGQGADGDVRAAVAAAAGEDERVRFLHIEVRGTSPARNAALHAASGEVIAMFDDDCEAAPDWLAVIDECLDDQPGVGVVGGALSAPTQRHRGPGNCPTLIPRDTVYDPVRDRRQAPAGWDWVCANVALRRSVLEQVGDFDECLGPGTPFPSCEDTDFKLRLEALGVTMRVTPRSIVHHTYGWRSGLSAVLRHQRNYARGNGAMAAKLSLMGDPRGAEWLAQMRADCLTRWYRRGDVVQLPAGIRRWHHFSAAYRECRETYAVDRQSLLMRRTNGTGRLDPLPVA